MGDIRYVSIVPKVKIWEKKLVTKNIIEKCLEVDSVDEVIKLLSNSTYNFENSQDYENVLSETFREVCKELSCDEMGKKVVEFFLIKYKYHNLKVMLKSKLLNLEPCTIFEKEEFSNIQEVDILLSAETEMSKKLRNLMNVYHSNEDVYYIESFFDKQMLESMLDVVNGLGSSEIIDYFKDFIDMQNLKTILRAKSVGRAKCDLKSILFDNGYISLDKFFEYYKKEDSTIFSSCKKSKNILFVLDNYSKNKSLVDLERDIDNVLFKQVNELRFATFGAEIIFAYLQILEFEIKNLRLIFSAKANSIENKLLLKRVRDFYV